MRGNQVTHSAWTQQVNVEIINKFQLFGCEKNHRNGIDMQT